MKQINVETATREQLVDFIRRMHSQLQREQERVKELESQISGFQEFIQEKNAEIRELRQQSDRLTEKSASDEETIGALIRQMEAMRLEQAPSSTMSSVANVSGPNTVRGRTMGQSTGKGHPSVDGVSNKRSPDTSRLIDSPGNGEAGRRPSRTPPPLKDNPESIVSQLMPPSAAAASAISSKMEEIAKLENKVRELMEVNAFYSAIVAQHDQEEKVRRGQKLIPESGRSEDDLAELRQEVERLQFHISNLDAQEEKLQRVIKATEAEKSSLKQENELLKKDSIQLEAEMAEMTREYARARRSLVAAASHLPSTIDVRLTYTDGNSSDPRAASMPPQNSSPGALLRTPLSSAENYTLHPQRRHASLPVVTAASRVSPLSQEGRQGVTGGSKAPPAPSTNTNSAWRARFNFRSLRPIRVRNPDAHEKDLLDRIHLYEEQLAQVALFEADRQRNFDEMERNRAEMFAAMNEQLEKQRREIRRLRKLHEDASLDSSLTARPSRNQSVGSVVIREEEEARAGLRRHGSHSPVELCLTSVPTSTQSLPNVESFNGVDDVDGVTGAALSERDPLATHSVQQRRFAPSTKVAGIASLQEELKWHEKEGRLFVWIEAMENIVKLAAMFNAITVHSYTEELAKCEAKLFSERDALTSELESLQLHNTELEAQLADVQAKLDRHSEAAEADLTAQASAEAEEPKCIESDEISTHFLEHKSVCAVYLAMDAYGAVIAHYLALLHKMRGCGVSDGTHDGPDDLIEEVTRDLAEVRATLVSLRLQPQGVPQESQAGLPAARLIPAAGPSPPQSLPSAYVAVAAMDTSEHTYSDNTALRSFDSSSSSVSSLPHPPFPEASTSVADQVDHLTMAGFADTSAPFSEQGDAEIHPSVNVFNDAPTASTAQEGPPRSNLVYESVASGDDEKPARPDNGTTPIERDSQKNSEGEALAQVSPDEADGTATSQFADCVEKGDGTGRISMAPDGAETVPPAGVISKEGGYLENYGDILPTTPISGGSEESKGREDGDVPTPILEVLPHITTNTSTITDANMGGGALTDAEHGASELRDVDGSSTLSVTSQLEMTEAEEAELLAHLEKEIVKGETATLAESQKGKAQAELEGTSLSSSDEGVINGDKVTKVESHHFEDDDEEEVDGQVAEVGSSTSSAAATSAKTKLMNPVTLDTWEQRTPFLSADSAPQGVAESDDTSSSNGENGKPDALFAFEPNKANTENGPETSFSSSSSNLSASSSSPNLPTNAVADEAQAAISETAAEDVKATAAPTLPPAGDPSMIPPTSLDELFGVHLPAAPLPPPPAEAPPNVFGTLATTHALHPPPSLFLEMSKMAGLSATANNCASMPTSPSSMFATPPQPTPSRTFFTFPAYDGSYAQPNLGAKSATSRGASSSSDDEFEADFDPFA